MRAAQADRGPAPCSLPAPQLAEHHYRLGDVYWKLRGRYRTEKQFAYAHFFDAASVEGHAQAPAFAALGRYFQEVEGKAEQAMRCYKRALALDPAVASAGSDGAPPSWVNNVLGLGLAAEGAGGTPAKPASGRSPGESGASAGGGQPLQHVAA